MSKLIDARYEDGREVCLGDVVEHEGRVHTVRHVSLGFTVLGAKNGVSVRWDVDMSMATLIRRATRREWFDLIGASEGFVESMWGNSRDCKVQRGLNYMQAAFPRYDPVERLATIRAEWLAKPMFGDKGEMR
jgi:hypothetical protein